MIIFNQLGCRCLDNDLALHHDVKEIPLVSVVEHNIFRLETLRSQVLVQVKNRFLFEHLGLLAEEAIGVEEGSKLLELVV